MILPINVLSASSTSLKAQNSLISEASQSDKLEILSLCSAPSAARIALWAILPLCSSILVNFVLWQYFVISPSGSPVVEA